MLKIVHHEFKKFIDAKIPEAHLHLARFDSRNIDEVVQQRIQPRSVGGSFFDEEPVDGRVVDGAVEQGFQISLQGEDGRAKFVRNVSEKFAARTLQFFQLHDIRFQFIDKFIHRARNAANLVVGCRFNMLLEVAEADFLNVLSDGDHRSGDPLRNKNTDPDDDRESNDSRPYDLPPDVVHNLLHFFHMSADADKPDILQGGREKRITVLFCDVEKVSSHRCAAADIHPY